MFVQLHAVVLTLCSSSETIRSPAVCCAGGLLGTAPTSTGTGGLGLGLGGGLFGAAAGAAASTASSAPSIFVSLPRATTASSGLGGLDPNTSLKPGEMFVAS